MPSLRRTLSLAAAAALALAAQAEAGTATGTLNVTATVLGGCSVTGGRIDFGQYVSGQAPNLDAVGQITFANCNGSISFDLDQGLGGSNVNDRHMKSGSSKLRYQLYRNTSRTFVWGVGAEGYGMVLAHPQSGKIDVFGRIAGGQVVGPGAYSDTINITLNF